jgi:hypothetical protein
MRMILVPGVLMILLVRQVAAAQQRTGSSGGIHTRAQLAQAIDQMGADLEALNKSHHAYQAAAKKLEALYSKLNKQAQAIAKAASQVKGAGHGPKGAGQMNGIGQGDGGQQQLLEATQEMQETQMSLNLQYLQHQSQMQEENRSYTAVSNIMKTKNGNVRNALANIK